MADGGMPNTFTFVPDAENARAFRDALGTFATGVTLVTIKTPDGPMGFVANSFSSLSMDPPLVIWAPAKSASRFPHYAAAKHYAIHILAEDQQELITRFVRGGAGFDGLDYEINAEGVPVVAEAAARFECEQHATYEGGDHLIVVGRVLRAATRDIAGLVFKKGRYGGFFAKG